MINWLALNALRFRYAIWIVVLGGTTILWWSTPPIQFDQSVESFFPETHPALISYKASKDSFGGDHLVFVAYDDPGLWSTKGMQRVRELANAITKIEGVERVDAVDQMPLPWLVDEETIAVTKKSGLDWWSEGLRALIRVRKKTVAWTVTACESDPRELQQTRERICRHPLFSGLLVDEGGLSTALIVKLGDPSLTNHRAAVTALRKLGDQFEVDHHIEHVAVAGPPILIVDGYESLDRDNQTLGVVAMLLMALTMLAAVRNPGWALLPLAAGLATWEVTKAFMVWFDLRLSLSTGPIVAQTIVLCMPAASHLAVRFSEVLRSGADRSQAAKEALTGVFMPVAWCSIAAASGYFAMWAATSVAPIAQFGLTMFVCNLMAGALSWWLSPGAMSLTLLSRRSGHDTTAAMSNGVGAMTAWVMARPRTTLSLFILPVILGAVGFSQLLFESNFINSFRAKAPIVRDYRFVEARMRGIGLVELVFPVPEDLTPDFIEQLGRTAQSLRDVDPDLVSGVVSLADILNLPKVEAADPSKVLGLKLLMLRLPDYSHFQTSVWNRQKNVMRILVRIRENAPAEQKEKCFAGMLKLVQSDLTEKAFVTGLSHLMTKITQAIAVTSFWSGGWSTLIALLMLCIALRSLPLAALAIAPTLLSVGLVLGLMGWIGLKIDMSTVFVASVAIGLSVDDTFHCLLRWKENLRAGQSRADALRNAYVGSGAGVVLSSAAVSLGFLAMLFSDFLPMFHFGWLISVATLGGSLGNLVVIPALLAWTTSGTANQTGSKPVV